MTLPFSSCNLRLKSLVYVLALTGLSSVINLPVRAQQAQSQSAGRELAASSASSNLLRNVAIPDWVLLDQVKPQKLNSAYAISMPLFDTQVYLDKTVTTFQRRIFVASEASVLSKVANYEIPFNPDYQQVKIHRIIIRRGNQVIDKTSSATIKLLQQEHEFDQGVMTGLVNATILVDDLRLHDELEFSYSVEGDNPVFAGKLGMRKAWDHIYAIGHKHFSISYPKHLTVQTRVGGSGNTKLQKTESVIADRKVVRWTGYQLAPLEFESHVPLEVEQFRYLQISQYQDWYEVMKWAEQLFKVESQSDQLNQLIARFAKITDPEMRVRSALEYVQSEIRYLSLSLGENSHRPAQPDQVLSRRYGDCKDKSLLLVSLLQGLGIQAHPVLIASSGHNNLQAMLPSPALFDHVIVFVKLAGREYYLDPTRNSQFGVLARQGQIHAGASVLLVDGLSRELKNIPDDWQVNASNRRSEKITVDEWNKAVKFQVRQSYEGIQAESMRHFLSLSTKEQIQKSLAASVLKTYPQAEAVGAPRIQDNRELNTISLEHDYSIRDFFQNHPEFWTFKYAILNMQERFHPVIAAQRRYPLAVDRIPASMHYQLALQLPPGFDGSYAPNSTTLDDEAFKARETISFRGRQLDVAVDLTILRDRVDPGRFDTYLANTRKLNQIVESNLKIYKNDLKPDATRLLIDPSARQKLQESNLAKIKRLTDEIEQRSDNALALCQRGLAYAQLRRISEAKKDLQQVSSSKATTEMLGCRARLYFYLGDFKNALNDVNQLPALDRQLQEIRALSLGQQSRWREASEVYSQLYKSQSDEIEKQSLYMLYLYSAFKAGVKQRENPDFAVESWISVLYAVLQGEKTDEQLMAYVHKQAPEQLDQIMAQCYFYLGTIAGNRISKVRARAYLQRALEKINGDSLLSPIVKVESEKPL